MGTIRVVLAEDHALMRDAVRLVFEETEDVVLVGEVANGHELLPLLKRVEPTSSSSTCSCPASTGSRASRRSPSIIRA